jgi:hypothetical protein
MRASSETAVGSNLREGTEPEGEAVPAAWKTACNLRRGPNRDIIA